MTNLRVLLASALSFAALLPTAAQSQTTVNWTNAAGGDWSDSSNWDGVAPITGAFDAFVDLSSSNPYNIAASTDVSIDSVTIDSQQATIQFGANFTVGNELSLQNGSLEFLNDSIFTGSMSIGNSGSVLFDDDSVFSGNIRVDGPDAAVTIDGELRNHAEQGSVITLENGGQLISEREVFVSEGTAIVGDGTINMENGYFSNTGGTIEVGIGQRLDLVDNDFGTDRFSSTGSIIVRDGGEFALSRDPLFMTNLSTGPRQNSQLVLDGGRASSDMSIRMIDASIYGNGTLEAPTVVLFTGEFSPGLRVGRIDIIGNVVAFESIPIGQADEMELIFDIAGTEQGVADGHDFLFIDGDVNFADGLGPYLRIDTLENVSLSELAGEALTIIELADSHEIFGVFANVESGERLETEDGRFEFDVFYGAGSSFGANRVVLTNFSVVGVPEPTALLLLLLASTGVFARRQRS